jgi:hypothetical protein
MFIFRRQDRPQLSAHNVSLVPACHWLEEVSNTTRFPLLFAENTQGCIYAEHSTTPSKFSGRF